MMQELVDTEKKYVSDLQYLCEVSYRLLCQRRSECAHSQIIGQIDEKWTDRLLDGLIIGRIGG